MKRDWTAAAAGIAAAVARTNGGAEIESERSARSAGLRYVSDDEPGITRRRRGRGFQYLNPSGATISDRDERSRIESLAIPPAWTDVWICRSPAGHIQATGRDARGRKQYRYHPKWRQVRDETKYHRLTAFARALPRIRRRVDRDLRRRALGRERVVATVVRLLDVTTIRVGNDEYARANRSFGLTTLRDRHVELDGHSIVFRFRGKGGKVHEVDIADPRVARVIKKCEELPGQHLFQYLDDDGEPAEVTSDDVNGYLRSASGDECTARTSGRGQAPSWRHRRSMSSVVRRRRRRPGSFPRSSRSPASSGTRRPCAVHATSTPTSSTLTWTARFGRAFAASERRALAKQVALPAGGCGALLPRAAPLMGLGCDPHGRR